MKAPKPKKPRICGCSHEEGRHALVDVGGGVMKHVGMCEHGCGCSGLHRRRRHGPGPVAHSTEADTVITGDFSGLLGAAASVTASDPKLERLARACDELKAKSAARMVIDIKKLRELRAAATQGPWEPGDNDWEINAVSFTEHDDDCAEDCSGMHPGLIVECARDYDLGSKDDRDLIVAAVNVLPTLLDELERLRTVAEIAARMDALLDWDGWMSTAPTDLDVTKMHMALQALEKKV